MNFITLFLKIIPLFLLLLVNLFANNTLTICGTGDNEKLLKNLGKAYELENPGIKINVLDSIGSTGGIKHTAEGKCNLGRIARKIKKREEKYNLNYILFSYSAVAFVTNKNIKKLDNLNEIDVKEIFSGEKKLWKSYDEGNKKKRFYKLFVNSSVFNSKTDLSIGAKTNFFDRNVLFYKTNFFIQRYFIDVSLIRYIAHHTRKF